MHRYRFPGEVAVPASCNKPKECKPYIILKVCPPIPYVKNKKCLPKVFDRAIVHCVPESLRCKYDAKFLLETFSGLVLYPRNLDKFCGYDFSDGEVVAVEAEIIQCKKEEVKCPSFCPTEKNTKICNCGCVKKELCKCDKEEKPACTTTITTTTDVVDGAISVKLFRILRVWKFEKKTLTGTVLYNYDNNGVGYYLVRETVDLATGVPYAKLVENVLNTQSYVINFEIFNIMGVSDPQKTMNDLLGKVITAEYVDYGQETRARIGIPIVIFKYDVVA